MAGTTRGIQDRLRELGNEKAQELATELMQNEKFQQAFATAFGKAMEARATFAKNMETVLMALQVPTHADIDRLSRRIDKLNGQLAQMSDTLEELARSPKPERKPAARRPAKKKAAKPAASKRD